MEFIKIIATALKPAKMAVLIRASSRASGLFVGMRHTNNLGENA
ncbi:MAG TPA: hypothetical protein VFX02_06510 [Gammaproteobacteria bacterium]|nr:hypothetical protein [Gammaproteobacteria bacterium]